MSSYLYYDAHFLKIEIFPQEKYALLTWNGRLTVECLEAGLTEVIKLFQQEGIFNIIGDNRLIKVPLRIEEQYMREVFSPTMVKEGLQKMAVIVEENVFAKLIIRKVIEDKIKVPVKYFNDVEKAKEWIIGDE